jgi:hypothetical protein
MERERHPWPRWRSGSCRGCPAEAIGAVYVEVGFRTGPLADTLFERNMLGGYALSSPQRPARLPRRLDSGTASSASRRNARPLSPASRPPSGKTMNTHTCPSAQPCLKTAVAAEKHSSAGETVLDYGVGQARKKKGQPCAVRARLGVPAGAAGVRHGTRTRGESDSHGLGG